MTNSSKSRGKGSQSPTSVLRIARSQTICRIHSRDFSDCLRFHAAQHPLWDDIKSVVGLPGLDSFPIPRSIAPSSSSPGFSAPKRLIYASKGVDPFKVLGPDIMRSVMNRLDARSLARCGVTSRGWESIAHADDLWVSKIASSRDLDKRRTCVSLWDGKRHVPAAALLPGLSKLAAYGISITDSRRCVITMDDLCNANWEYRFKETVPQYWLDLDPSRRGETPMRRFFHRDGFHSAGAGDEVWGGHECSFTIIDEGEGDPSNFVRINHWPVMAVSRTDDWGWLLQNDICVYRSLPDSANILPPL